VTSLLRGGLQTPALRGAIRGANCIQTVPFEPRGANRSPSKLLLDAIFVGAEGSPKAGVEGSNPSGGALKHPTKSGPDQHEANQGHFSSFPTRYGGTRLATARRGQCVDKSHGSRSALLGDCGIWSSRRTLPSRAEYQSRAARSAPQAGRRSPPAADRRPVSAPSRASTR